LAADPWASAARNITKADIDASINAFMATFTARQETLVATIGTCAAASLALAETGPLVPLACAVTLGYQIGDLASALRTDLRAIYAVPVDLSIATDANGNLASVAPDSAWTPLALTVNPGQATNISVQLNLRSIGPSDRGVASAVFALIDAIVGQTQQVVSFLPGWAQPDFTPASPATTSTAVDGSDLSVSADGCDFTPDAQGGSLVCNQTSSDDVNLTATITYENSFGSASGSLPVTVRATYVTVGTPTWSIVDTLVHEIHEGLPASGCQVDMNIPITGNTPVTFTGWHATGVR
jgi:hypothetical protein